MPLPAHTTHHRWWFFCFCMPTATTPSDAMLFFHFFWHFPKSHNFCPKIRKSGRRIHRSASLYWPRNERATRNQCKRRSNVTIRNEFVHVHEWVFELFYLFYFLYFSLFISIRKHGAGGFRAFLLYGALPWAAANIRSSDGISYFPIGSEIFGIQCVKRNKNKNQTNE